LLLPSRISKKIRRRDEKERYKKQMKPSLIAPCGMNCNLCHAHLREKNRCPGCRAYSADKPNTRTTCIIKNCNILKDNNLKYCSKKCENYPCKRLKDLDKRYRTKYTMSMIDNLESISKNGIRRFVSSEEIRWMKNGKIFCVHTKKYF
jgi:hypothetical protein